MFSTRVLCKRLCQQNLQLAISLNAGKRKFLWRAAAPRVVKNGGFTQSCRKFQTDTVKDVESSRKRLSHDAPYGCSSRFRRNPFTDTHNISGRTFLRGSIVHSSEHFPAVARGYIHSCMLIQRQEAENPSFPELGNPNIWQLLTNCKFSSTWLIIFWRRMSYQNCYLCYKSVTKLSTRRQVPFSRHYFMVYHKRWPLCLIFNALLESFKHKYSIPNY